MANYTAQEKQLPEFEEKVLEINRISRTVKGGRRLRFRALVLVGNRKGKVGFGIAKASEVVVAINKAKKQAMKNIILVPIVNDTIPHLVTASFGSSDILLKPAPVGTSLIAGGSIRSILEIAGIKNIVSKSLGSNTKINVVSATFKAILALKIGNNTKKSVKAEDEKQKEIKSEETKAEAVKPIKKATNSTDKEKSTKEVKTEKLLPKETAAKKPKVEKITKKK
jgi:small subunit ribosomal protein S5